MRLYSWTMEEGLTDAYHSGGTAQAIAETEDGARELIRRIGRVDHEMTSGCGSFSVLPDACAGPASNTFPLVETEGFTWAKRVWIYPDAGCC